MNPSNETSIEVLEWFQSVSPAPVGAKSVDICDLSLKICIAAAPPSLRAACSSSAPRAPRPKEGASSPLNLNTVLWGLARRNASSDFASTGGLGSYPNHKCRPLGAALTASRKASSSPWTANTLEAQTRCAGSNDLGGGGGSIDAFFFGFFFFGPASSVTRRTFARGGGCCTGAPVSY